MAKKAAAPAASTDKAPWYITQWNGTHDNYQCGICQFAHLDKAVLAGHVKDRHHTTLADAPSAAPVTET